MPDNLWDFEIPFIFICLTSIFIPLALGVLFHEFFDGLKMLFLVMLPFMIIYLDLRLLRYWMRMRKSK